METLVERQRRRARLVLALRLAVLVFLVGGWELGVRVGLIDPFFFGQPSGIVDKTDRLVRRTAPRSVRCGSRSG